MAKIYVKKEIPSMMMFNSRPYYLNMMLYFDNDIENHKKNLRKNKINFRTVLYRHPNEKLIAILFYVDKKK